MLNTANTAVAQGGAYTPVRQKQGQIRVVLVSTWKTPCGITDYTQSLALALRGAGCHTSVAPVDREKIGYMSRAELRSHWRRVGQRIDADIVHIQHEFGFFAGTYGFRESLRNFQSLMDGLRERHIAVAVTFHTEPVFLQDSQTDARSVTRRLVLAHMWRSIARSFNSDSGLIALVHSQSTRRVLLDSGFGSGSVALVKQGISPCERADPALREASRRELGYSPDDVVLGMFGFVSAYKGYYVALEALRSLSSRFHLLIVGGPHPRAGDSAMDTVLEMKRRHRALDRRVRVTGYLGSEDLRSHQRAVDFWLAPYLREPVVSSSAALSFALASGRPVVATAIPAFRELHEEARCLELVTPERPMELAFAVERLSQDPARIATLIAKGEQYTAANTWDCRATEHTALYRRLVASRR